MTESNPNDLVVRGLCLPSELAGFRRGEVVDNELNHPGLGVTVRYRGGVRGEATVFVYDKGIRETPANSAASIMQEEFAQAMRELVSGVELGGGKAALAGAYAVLGTKNVQPYLCAEFHLNDRMGSGRSFLYLSRVNENFVKLRVTVPTSSNLDSTAYEFAQALALENWLKAHEAELRSAPVTRVGTESYEVFGLVRIAIFGPWRWQLRDLGQENILGVVFGCYPQDDPHEAAHLVIADSTDDPDEPDLSTLTPEKITAFGEFCERTVRDQMLAEGRRLVSWRSPELVDMGSRRLLLSAYVARDQGRERQHLEARMATGSRKLYLSGCYDLHRADELAKPILASVQNAIILEPRVVH